MLGAVPSTEYAWAERTLTRPGGLLLYSDGLIENRSQSLDEGLSALVSAMTDSTADTADDLCRIAEQELLDESTRADDVCMLAVRLT